MFNRADPIAQWLQENKHVQPSTAATLQLLTLLHKMGGYSAKVNEDFKDALFKFLQPHNQSLGLLIGYAASLSRNNSDHRSAPSNKGEVFIAPVTSEMLDIFRDNITVSDNSGSRPSSRGSGMDLS